ncbi:hypothetical protein A0H81_05781 [Grifola frondosa]|uniref:DUF3669 domain-containing protein n=1 Tax=Grifola frondosa TaxID=5627 RepID=A0A1C7MDR9_GRIFR|nr:hypothetical protein A0H81_05781 [Grifola frondosa]
MFFDADGLSETVMLNLNDGSCSEKHVGSPRASFESDVFGPFAEIAEGMDASFDLRGSCVDALSGTFFANEPYYPGPHPSDHLFEAFKRTYIDVCPLELRHLAPEFIWTIESRSVYPILFSIL